MLYSDILGVTVKKDMNNYEDEDIEDDGDDDDDETQLMGGMDNEDRDETWKPSAGGDIKPKVLQVFGNYFFYVKPLTFFLFVFSCINQFKMGLLGSEVISASDS